MAPSVIMVRMDCLIIDLMPLDARNASKASYVGISSTTNNIQSNLEQSESCLKTLTTAMFVDQKNAKFKIKFNDKARHYDKFPNTVAYLTLSHQETHFD